MKKFAILAFFGLAILALATTATSENSKQESSEIIELPDPRIDGGISVENALKERRSIRSFTDEPLYLVEVSQLLWAAQGETDDAGHRSAPSAMATYPLEVYLLAGNVIGLPAGIYHYSPQDHNLIVIASGNRIPALFNTSSDRVDWREKAPAVFVITGVFERMNKIPGQDSSRFVYIEAGAAAENLLLEVVSLGLGSTYTAGFDENRTKEYLRLSEGETPIGILPVGRPA
ncbi:MAG TPA: SagB/ThcOx family dehydrogenase [Methanotrichaceae archaeon]|nr:SagB/ThcOx family dehydrogenase [Methanotrichaceae archaeon]